MGPLSRRLWLTFRIPHRSPTTPGAKPLVWADPLSLATTYGIAFAFFSSGYWDVSLHRVRVSSPIYSERNVHLLRHTGYPIRKSPGHSLSAALRGLSQLKHVLHRLLAQRHSPCALSNLFLDPIIFTALKQKKKKLISKPFSLKFCKIEPGQSSAKGSINKIADCSIIPLTNPRHPAWTNP